MLKTHFFYTKNTLLRWASDTLNQKISIFVCNNKYIGTIGLVLGSQQELLRQARKTCRCLSTETSVKLFQLHRFFFAKERIKKFPTATKIYFIIHWSFVVVAMANLGNFQFLLPRDLTKTSQKDFKQPKNSVFLFLQKRIENFSYGNPNLVGKAVKPLCQVNFQFRSRSFSEIWRNVSN